jgi:hypothetical protein
VPADISQKILHHSAFLYMDIYWKCVCQFKNPKEKNILFHHRHRRTKDEKNVCVES